MRTMFSLLLALASICPRPQAEEASAGAPNATNQFQIKGMSCDGCARGIASELQRVRGVFSAEVTFSNKLAIVAYNTNRVSAEALGKVILDAGYEARLITTRKPKSH
ncbi:MAG: heavy metal-associated domain-containing protein [Verrucomicrobiota bacterium]